MPRTERYQAAVLAGPGAVRVERRKAAPPGPRQVRVRLEGCGVCGSNLPLWEGRPWFSYPCAPGAPGHEGWGRVEALGAGINGEVSEGQRVALLSYHAFAEVDVADVAAVVPLPESLPEQPFPGEALGCAMNVFRRAEIAAHHTVAVVGVGFLGALLIALARRTGARVIACSRRESALAMARTMGATEAVSLEDGQTALAAVQAFTNGAGCERVIEATGFQDPLTLAGEMTAERGRLIIAGYHQDGLRQVNLQLWNWRGLDVINAHERDPARYVEGMREAVMAIARGELDPRPLYTHGFTLDQLGVALDHLRAREGAFLKAWVKYE